MARIHDTITISSGHAMPSLGSLIGSRVSGEVFDAINSYGHASFFGSEFDTMRAEFFNRHVRPMDQVNLEISRTVNAVMNPDRIRILDTVEEFPQYSTMYGIGDCVLCLQSVRGSAKVAWKDSGMTRQPSLTMTCMVDRLIISPAKTWLQRRTMMVIIPSAERSTAMILIHRTMSFMPSLKLGNISSIGFLQRPTGIRRQLTFLEGDSEGQLPLTMPFIFVCVLLLFIQKKEQFHHVCMDILPFISRHSFIVGLIVFLIFRKIDSLGNGGGAIVGAAAFVILAIILFFSIKPWAFVDNYELGYVYDARTGQIHVVDHTGYVPRVPFFENVHTVDLRPRQVCINVGSTNQAGGGGANSRVLNCKLVRFNPKGLTTFLSYHGRGDYSGDQLDDLLKIYAYDGTGKTYPFLDVLRELKSDDGASSSSNPVYINPNTVTSGDVTTNQVTSK